ncbi:hypothetical protein ACB092_05G153800 [Castanea dentata]
MDKLKVFQTHIGKSLRTYINHLACNKSFCPNRPRELSDGSDNFAGGTLTVDTTICSKAKSKSASPARTATSSSTRNPPSVTSTFTLSLETFEQRNSLERELEIFTERERELGDFV